MSGHVQQSRVAVDAAAALGLLFDFVFLKKTDEENRV